MTGPICALIVLVDVHAPPSISLQHVVAAFAEIRERGLVTGRSSDWGGHWIVADDGMSFSKKATCFYFQHFCFIVMAGSLVAVVWAHNLHSATWRNTHIMEAILGSQLCLVYACID